MNWLSVSVWLLKNYLKKLNLIELVSKQILKEDHTHSAVTNFYGKIETVRPFSAQRWMISAFLYIFYSSSDTSNSASKVNYREGRSAFEDSH